MADPYVTLVEHPRTKRNTIMLRADREVYVRWEPFRRLRTKKPFRLEYARRWHRLVCNRCGARRTGVAALWRVPAKLQQLARSIRRVGIPKGSTLLLDVSDLTWITEHKCKGRKP